jgi:hypothetical protein
MKAVHRANSDVMRNEAEFLEKHLKTIDGIK